MLLFRPFAGNVSSLVTLKRNNKCHIYSKNGKDTELENVSKEEAESSKDFLPRNIPLDFLKGGQVG